MTIETLPSIEERVAAGAAWLDENRPGWVDRIDLNVLDIESPCGCILGQEYGEYQNAPIDARRSHQVIGLGGRRGFDAYWGDPDLSVNEQYDLLAAEWRRLIESRRAVSR